jgi:hypothetical protein
MSHQTNVLHEADVACDETATEIGRVLPVAANYWRHYAGDECLVECDGEYIEFRLPALTVRIHRGDPRPITSRRVLEEGAWMLLAAMRYCHDQRGVA